MTAYEIGRVVGLALGFAIPAFVVLSGWRARRTSRRVREEALAAVPLESGPVDPASLPGLRGRKRMVIGSVLLVLVTLGQVGSLARGGSDQVVALPPTLLDLARNDTAVRSELDRLRLAMPSDFRGDVGYYGTRLGGVLVMAAAGDVDDAASIADELLGSGRSLSQGYVSPYTTVPAGPLGGFARCSTLTRTQGNAQRVAFACAFASDDTVLLVIDSVATTLDEAADRSRSVRSSVVRPDGDPLPSLSPAPSPSATPTVRLRLPARILGAELEREDLAKERAEFIKETAEVFTQADMGLYLGDGKTFLVETAAGDFRMKALFLRLFRNNIKAETGKDPGEPVRVAPGRLGGDGWCWRTDFDGVKAHICVLLDDQAYVATYDLESTKLSTAADLARKVRAAVEQRTP